MTGNDLSRRALLQALVAALGAVRPSAWTGIAQAARAAAVTPAAVKLAFFTAAEAADVEAVAAQIIPTDDTPGAREAGVVYFIDRALATFLSQLAGDYRAHLAAFQAAFREQRPGVAVVRGAHVRTADRVPEDRRSHAVLRHDAAADASRHVLHARLRRQPEWRRLDAPRIRRSARLPAAVRPLRSRLSRLRRRTDERRHERARRIAIPRPSTSPSSARAPRVASSHGNWRRPDCRWSCSSRARGCRRRTFDHDELKHWYLGGITNDAVKNPQTFRNDPAKKAELQIFKPALWYGRAVGGASLHYTANYWRFREIDFIERSVLGAIPGTGFDDWPITYADLEPLLHARSSGRSACRVWPAPARSIRRAPSRIRCRRCR